MTDRFRDRLSEYIDGELEAPEEALVERHVETCAECSEIVTDLEAVRARAGEVVDRAPDSDLWPGIAERIADDGVLRPVADLSSRRGSRFRRIALTVPQLAAAAVAVASLSTAGAWMALSDSGTTAAAIDDAPAPTGPGATLASTDAAEGAPLAEQYGSVIAELEQALFGSPERLNPDTEASLRRALLKIDRAIEDAMRALEELPGDPYLEQHVENTMRRKTEFLQRAVQLSQS
ncbi:MAG: zf-HC2 domain-containing protein [Gemmatimonadota bacterium]|nr:zf-HC2 domain-containing protein [Gemmatimonadota bacterium]